MSKDNHHIFISHSSIDSKIAFMLCEAFENQGVKCWIAPRDVRVGMPYAKSIVEGIENSQAVIVLFSTNSDKSDGVLQEIEVARNSKVPIIPIRIEDVFPTKSMKFYIMANHWIDAINPKSVDDFNKFLKEVKSTINLENIDTTSYELLSTDKNIKKEKKSNSFSDYIFPFIVSFVFLVILSDIVYPSLELQDVVYSFLGLAFVLAKGFVFFRGRIRG